MEATIAFPLPPRAGEDTICAPVAYVHTTLPPEVRSVRFHEFEAVRMFPDFVMHGTD